MGDMFNAADQALGEIEPRCNLQGDKVRVVRKPPVEVTQTMAFSAVVYTGSIGKERRFAQFTAQPLRGTQQAKLIRAP